MLVSQHCIKEVMVTHVLPIFLAAVVDVILILLRECIICSGSDLPVGYFYLFPTSLKRSGCILGGSALGSPRISGEAVGKKAAEELLEAVPVGNYVKH